MSSIIVAPNRIGPVSGAESYQCDCCGVRNSPDTKKQGVWRQYDWDGEKLCSMWLCFRCSELPMTVALACATCLIDTGRPMPKLHEWLAAESEPVDVDRWINPKPAPLQTYSFGLGPNTGYRCAACWELSDEVYDFNLQFREDVLVVMHFCGECVHAPVNVLLAGVHQRARIGSVHEAIVRWKRKQKEEKGVEPATKIFVP